MRYFLPIILLAATLGIFFMYTDSTYKKVTELRAEEAAYNEALGNSKKLQAVRDELVSKYNTLPPESIDRLTKLLPDSAGNIRLIIEIEQLAAQHGLQVNDVRYTSTADEEEGQFASAEAIAEDQRGYGKFEFDVSLVGTYDSFVQFIGDLERSLRIVDVVGLRFASVNQGGNQPAGTYTFDVSLRTYWLKN